MDTSISRLIRADPAIVFELAAAVEDWPRILPHYRWVRVLASRPDGTRAVSMAARRDVCLGLAVPLRWTAIQRIDAHERRIQFEHVRGITRGMRVAWTIEQADVAPTESGAPALMVQIRHVFDPRWPLPDALVRLVVGDYFVNGVARRTLRRIGELAEARTAIRSP